MKGFDSFRQFFEIETTYSPKCYLLAQSNYISTLAHARLSDTHTTDTLIEIRVNILMNMYHTIVSQISSCYLVSKLSLSPSSPLKLCAYSNVDLFTKSHFIHHFQFLNDKSRCFILCMVFYKLVRIIYFLSIVIFIYLCHCYF